MQQKHASSNGDLFSAQLWKAVGLQPKTLSIPRVHFFPEEAATASCVPSSSRGSEDRQGRHSNSTAFNDTHKRRRSVGYASSCPHDDDIASEPVRKCYHEASCQAPDLEAMMQAPRRPRTLASRRPLRELHRLAAEFPLPSLEPEEDLSPANNQQQQQQRYDHKLHRASPPAAKSPEEHQGRSPAHQCNAEPRWQSPTCADDGDEQCGVPTGQLPPNSCYCEDDQPHLIQLGSGHPRKAPLPDVSPDAPGVRTSTKDSPASHSAESSLGVFMDLHETERGVEQGDAEDRDVDGHLGSASPGNSAGQDHHSKLQQHMVWSRGSPLSDVEETF